MLHKYSFYFLWKSNLHVQYFYIDFKHRFVQLQVFQPSAYLTQLIVVYFLLYFIHRYHINIYWSRGLAAPETAEDDEGPSAGFVSPKPFPAVQSIVMALRTEDKSEPMRPFGCQELWTKIRWLWSAWHFVLYNLSVVRTIFWWAEVPSSLLVLKCKS